MVVDPMPMRQASCSSSPRSRFEPTPCDGRRCDGRHGLPLGSVSRHRDEGVTFAAVPAIWYSHAVLSTSPPLRFAMTSGSPVPKHPTPGRQDPKPQARSVLIAPAPAILSVRDLHLAIAARRRHTPILRGVSLDVAPGEVHGLVGESGAGKTMIGRVILGIQPSAARIVRGSVVFGGPGRHPRSGRDGPAPPDGTGASPSSPRIR